MSEEVIFKPIEEFSKIKSDFAIATNEYFDELVKKSNINIEENRNHVKIYNSQQNKVNHLKIKLNDIKSVKTFLIVISIISFVAAAFLMFLPFIFKNIEQYWYFFLIALVLISGAIYSLIMVNTKLKDVILKKQEELKKEQIIASKYLETCYNDMYPLNNLFDWQMAPSILSKVSPLFKFDRYFTNNRYLDMLKNFNLYKYNDENTSILNCLSGELSGNPFVMVKSLGRKMGTKLYSGSIVISWTTTHTDSNGNTHVDTHTETLTATISKPCPKYMTTTKLHYGNEAAPKLNFCRLPQHGDDLNEKQREKTIKNRMKDIQKKAEEQIKKGTGNFTPMGNDAFDVFFHALNRNDEVEFRLLFTPLAQQNMLALILNNKPYGDDFIFDKFGSLNTIIADHSQNFNYNVAPNYFKHYDYDEIQNKFTSYCNEFCQSIYFAFAPILSIPMYQMHKAHSSIYKDNNIDTSLSRFEKEGLANKIGHDYFRPKKADKFEPVMIKYDSSNSNNNVDTIHFLTSSYEKIKKVEFVSKMGGDGHMHTIPVDYYEYKEVNGESDITVIDLNCSEQKFNNFKKSSNDSSLFKESYTFERGLFAFGLSSSAPINSESINSLFKKIND